MKKLVLVAGMIAGLMGLAAASGCGSNDTPGTGPGAKQAYQPGGAGSGQGSNCSEQFVSDYNEIAAHTATSVDDLKAMKVKIQAFKAKYAGVQCVVERDGKKVTFDVNTEADKAIDQIDRALNQIGNGGNGNGFESADMVSSLSFSIQPIEVTFDALY